MLMPMFGRPRIFQRSIIGAHASVQRSMLPRGLTTQIAILLAAGLMLGANAWVEARVAEAHSDEALSSVDPAAPLHEDGREPARFVPPATAALAGLEKRSLGSGPEVSSQDSRGQRAHTRPLSTLDRHGRSGPTGHGHFSATTRLHLLCVYRL